MNIEKKTYWPWSLRILLASVLAGFVALSTFAQPVENPVPKTVRLDEIERLMKEGQLKMQEAVKMAEEHSKGLAFQTSCMLRPGPFKAGTDKTAPEGESDPNELRLEYRVVCVVKAQPVTVIIDGKEKKVITPPKPPEPEPKPGPDPVPDPAQ